MSDPQSACQKFRPSPWPIGPRKNMGMHVFMENIMSVHVQPPYFCWLRGVGIRSGFSVYPFGVTATSAIEPPSLV